ncbi:phosphoadenylyl-sulfate reductase [Lichenicoccus sp.]|uniref:phosphoadenylyl-sulfate reductase n=1 Tax=Lichenicoccus sp. TaxID=2781899 RepID=UPI003D0EE75B
MACTDGSVLPADDSSSSFERETACGVRAVRRDAIAALRLRERQGVDGPSLLADALCGPLADQLAVVSSFGAESAVLLAVVAGINPATPVIFLQTGKHFPETLAYRDRLAEHLGLSDVRDVAPDQARLRSQDPTGELWYYDDEACCAVRKVGPLEQALLPFAGWITGRKRFQAATRSGLAVVEQEAGRLKLNPLAGWDQRRLQDEFAARALPRHPLVDQGYRSIGCAVCTRAVGSGEDGRAGRWSGSGKVECGIHRVPA